MDIKFKRGDKVKLKLAPKSIYIVIGEVFATDYDGKIEEVKDTYWLLSVSIQSNPQIIHQFHVSELESFDTV